MLTTLLMALLLWGGAALVAALLFALGAGVGRRRGYEEGRRDAGAEVGAPTRITLPELPEVRRGR
jgi:hypothetical protein